MRYLILSCIAVFCFCLPANTWAQCACPKMSLGHFGSSAVKTFSLSGHSLGICGNRETVNERDEFNGFILYECGQLYAAKSWGETQTCTIAQEKDTLMVAELMPVANDKNMQVKWEPLYVTAFFYVGDTLRQKTYFRQDEIRYTPAQVAQVVNDYKKLYKPLKNYDAALLAMHRLFWAYVSGSAEAGQLLEHAAKKLGPFDGAVSEEYDEIISRYELYKREK